MDWVAFGGKRGGRRGSSMFLEGGKGERVYFFSMLLGGKDEIGGVFRRGKKKKEDSGARIFLFVEKWTRRCTSS